LVVGVVDWAADRLLEDGRVGGDAHDVLVADQLGEVAGGQPLAAEVVQPDRHAFVAEALQCVSHDLSLLPRTSGQRLTEARDSWAASATFSGVNPNSRKSTLASAEAPKCSSETIRPCGPT